MSDEPSTPSTQKEKLSFREKFSVGTGGFTLSLGNQSVRTTGQGVLNMILGIPAQWVGIVLAIPLLWDAITDPIMGNISDHWHSKYGRRRPFIFIGAILMGLTFASIWMIPLEWGDAGKLTWFLATSLLFYTSYTIFSVPYIALTYEMTSDYSERTAVQGYVTFWNRLGEMTYMGLIPLSLIFVAWKYGYADTSTLTMAEKMEGIQTSAAVYGFIGMTLFGMLPAFFGKERNYELSSKEKQGEKKEAFWTSAKTTLQNKAFAILCTLAVFTIVAGMFASNMDWYLLIYYLSDGDIAVGTQWKLIVTVGYAIVGILGIPVIVWLTSKVSKIQGFMFVYGMMVTNAVLRWFVYRPGHFDEPLVWTSLPEILTSLMVVGKSLLWLDPLTGGVFWIGVGVLGQSMIADVCDDDEIKNGHRREGMFGAIYGWSMKASFALSFVLIGFFLQFIGFDPQWGSTRYLNLKASADQHASDTADFAVSDDESGQLSLTFSEDRSDPKPGTTVVTFTRDASFRDLIVHLKSTDTDIMTVPESITLPKGSKNLDVTISVAKGITASRSVYLIAKSKGHATIAQKVTIMSTEKGTSILPVNKEVKVSSISGLSIQCPEVNISEKEGQCLATITRDSEATEAVIVKLSSDSERASVPETVTIPMGSKTAQFKVSAVDDILGNGTRAVTIIARADGHTIAKSTMDVIDDDAPALTVWISGYEMSEKGGEVVATVARNGQSSGPLVVSLKSSSPKDATVPTTVTIPEGQDRVEVKISAVDNDRVDGQQSPNTFLSMRIAMCLGAAGPAILCFFLLSFYPLTREKTEENSTLLEAIHSKKYS